MTKGQATADSLFASGKYFEAAVAYEKWGFDHPESQAEALLKKAYAYKALGDYSSALSNLDRVRNAKSDSIQQLVMYERILLASLMENFPLAYNHLLKWDFKWKQEDASIEILRFSTLIGLGELEKAEKLLLGKYEILGFTQEMAIGFFEDKWKLKDPDKAYKISLILPGVGQMYAGSFWKGVASGTIQAGLVVFTGYHLYHGYFFTGGMTGAALFYTFYLGGARYAKQMAEKKNEELKSLIRGKFIDQVKREGKKPRR